ncbi:class I SAM-dependent methyltransferase [Anaeromyxobacter oryzae]|uniref:Methyltransferase type 11 n=1 Tax=Anaeromyxobacter oryzae TaxID=2918170 RepID=A0ABM7X3Y6_9BACT|nr:methyltransferase domain-containing protein [Anaeromyxobacter oryzae]BDG06520.1 hypothetical protein AMOR_55160 [Anaeromyxobacter oryzae]
MDGIPAAATDARTEVDRLFADHDHLRRRLRADVRGVATQLHAERYPLVALEYIVAYLEHIKAEHIDNPQAAVYVESELGAPRRQAEYVGWLVAAGLEVRGKSCLDVGCGNGGLALACVAAGARRVVGVDVADHRIVAGREMCRDKPIELRNANILEEDLGETFDVILCTDVLEHVPQPDRLLRRIGDHLEPSERSFACVSLYNKFYPRSVLSEPHYDVPGLILLPYEVASALWAEVRAAYRSKVEYEVFHWHSYSEYEAMARAAGLRMRPYHGEDAVNAAVPEMSRYAEALSRLESDVEAKLRASPLPAARAEQLRGTVAAYLEDARRDHAACLRAPTTERYAALFAKYYAQPLLMIMQRPRPQWWRRWLSRGGVRAARRATR